MRTRDMVTLTMHDGRPALQLESRGKPMLYTLERLPPRGGERLYRLTCGEKSYTVRYRPGSWRCSCPAFRYSRGLVRDCKHAKACRELAEILKPLLRRAPQTA